MVVGRVDECAQLRKVLTEAGDGRPGVLVLRGDPGIGKTHLIEYAASVANGFRVIRMQGHEMEREIPFATLSMLTGPLLASGPQLPPDQLAALEGALGLGSGERGDQVGIAAATLAAVGDAAERGPLLLAVDDLHLIDAPTLSFVLRRLDREPVAVVMAARGVADVSSDLERWLEPYPHLTLDGLGLSEARRLTQQHEALSEAVWSAAGGNPLALLEITTPQGGPFLDEPIPLSFRLLRDYSTRLSTLPPPTPEALLLLAAAGRSTDVIDDALGARGLSRAALEPAEERGLVALGAGTARFTHPLVCSAAYYSQSPAVRREAHRTLADAYVGRSAPGATQRRAFHLAAATATPDEEVAVALTAAARSATAWHGHATAAALHERAARLSPPGRARTQRILDAAMAGQAAGTLEAVGPLLDLAIAESDDDDLRTLAQHLQCRIRMWSGQPGRARDQLLDLADRTEAGMPVWSAVMRSQAAIVSIAFGEQRAAAPMVDRAAALVEGLPEEKALPVLVARAVTCAINGQVGEARVLLERCAPLLAGCDPLSIDQLLVLAALAYASIEETSTARRWLQTGVRGSRAVQAAGLLPFQLSWLTLVCWMDGEWAKALAHGLEAVRVAEETGWRTELPNCLIALATVEATLGQDASALEHADLAARIGMEGSQVFTAHAARVKGLAALGAGRYVEAADELGVAAEFALARRLGDPVLFNWAADLTEASVRAGRRGAADRAQRAAAQEAEETDRPTERTLAARCARLLASSLADGCRAFDQALAWHERGTQPFQQARTQLCYGEHLRRHSQRGEAWSPRGRAGHVRPPRRPTLDTADGDGVAGRRRRHPHTGAGRDAADTPGGAGRRRRGRRRHQRRSRRPPLPRPEDDRVPPLERLPQAGHPLAGGTRADVGALPPEIIHQPTTGATPPART